MGNKFDYDKSRNIIVFEDCSKNKKGKTDKNNSLQKTSYLINPGGSSNIDNSLAITKRNKNQRAASMIRATNNTSSIDGEVVRHACGSNLSGSQEATVPDAYENSIASRDLHQEERVDGGNQRYLIMASTATEERFSNIAASDNQVPLSIAMNAV